MSQSAYILAPANDLIEELEFFQEIGFKLHQIYPDDNPRMAHIKGFGTQVRIDKNFDGNPPQIVIFSLQPMKEMTSPSGTVVQFKTEYDIVKVPKHEVNFEVRKLRYEDPWVIGRAGMLYRDLLPSRAKGLIMASHIHIPQGGPVPDMVHFHTIGFQLIYCYKGWVKLVYEDQGEPFVLNAGDCVNQPPQIRHQVLEASDNLEVIEIGIPAVHMTTIDHEMTLPNDVVDPERIFKGQKFRRFIRSDNQWESTPQNGLLKMDTKMTEFTSNLVDINVFKTELKTLEGLTSSSDINFCFVLEGDCSINCSFQEENLSTGDAFILPKNSTYMLNDCSNNLEILSVELKDLNLIQP